MVKRLKASTTLVLNRNSKDHGEKSQLGSSGSNERKEAWGLGVNNVCNTDAEGSPATPSIHAAYFRGPGHKTAKHHFTTQKEQ